MTKITFNPTQVGDHQSHPVMEDSQHLCVRPSMHAVLWAAIRAAVNLNREWASERVRQKDMQNDHNVTN